MAVYHAKTKIVRIAVQRIACGPLVAAAPAYRAEVRWSTAVGKRMSRRSAKCPFIDNKTLDSLKKNKNITMVTLEKLCRIVGCTPNDVVRFEE